MALTEDLLCREMRKDMPTGLEHSLESSKQGIQVTYMFEHHVGHDDIERIGRIWEIGLFIDDANVPSLNQFLCQRRRFAGSAFVEDITAFRLKPSLSQTSYNLSRTTAVVEHLETT
jgi:hypothetical protein